MNEVHINTIGGVLNVINIPTQPNSTVREYCAVLNQVGVSNPTAQVVKDTIQVVGGFPISWTRTGIGVYNGNLVGAFVGDNCMLSANGKQTGTVSLTQLEKVDDDNITLTTQDVTLAVADVWEVNVGISNKVNTSTSEEIFTYMLSQLDTNQLALWQKIVVRDGLTVVEVDGATWRRTGNFASSSVTINS